jgi:hypothetical protein
MRLDDWRLRADERDRLRAAEDLADIQMILQFFFDS